MINLRSYQKDMIHALYTTWANTSQAAVAYLPTGSGKTITALDIAKEVVEDGRKVLVITERIVINSQWVESAHKIGVESVGVLRGADTRDLDAQLIIASEQTIAARAESLATDDWLSEFTVVIVDEAHYLRTHSARAVEIITEAGGYAVGLTATPNAPGMREIYKEIVIGTTIPELVDTRHLVEPVLKAPEAAVKRTGHALEQVRVRAGDYVTSDLTLAMEDEAQLASAVAVWKEHANNKPTIVFCVTKEHARKIGTRFEAEGIANAVITEDTPPVMREMAFSAFERGELNVLISVNVLAVGFDSPRAEVALMLRPTRSLMLWIQQCGRVLRPYEGKEKALILDVAGNSINEKCALGHPMEYRPPSRLPGKHDTIPGTAPVKSCPECGTVVPLGVKECPECHCLFTSEQQEDAPGTGVRAIGMAVVNHNAPVGELSAEIVYRMYLHIARERGYSRGAPYHATRDFWRQYHNCLPAMNTRHWDTLGPIEPSSRFLEMDRQRRREYARKKAAERGDVLLPQVNIIQRVKP